MPEGVADAVLVNVGNGHTICVVTLDGRLAGVFEHHTSAVDGPRLEDLLLRFLAGGLDNDEVREDGGHGAVMGADAQAVDLMRLPMYATGPRRALLAGSKLPLEYAAPHGDMMLTGCFGLLHALRDRYPESTRIRRDRRRLGAVPPLTVRSRRAGASGASSQAPDQQFPARARRLYSPVRVARREVWSARRPAA